MRSHKKPFNHLLLVLLVPFCIWLTFNITSCTKESKFEDSLIQVDSIKVDYAFILSELFVGELVEIDLFGIISYDGCARFSHCDTYIQDNNLIIEAWKTRDVEAVACPTVMVYLEHHISIDGSELRDSFNIKIKQPDGSFLTKQVNKTESAMKSKKSITK